MNARLVFVSIALIVSSSTVHAQGASQQLLGQFNDWSAYAATTDKGKLCFAITQPKKRAPEGLKRDPAYMFVSHRPADKIRNEISVQVGFSLKGGSTADIAITGQNFSLMTQNERAWSNGQDDSKIVDAMRKGADVVIKSTSLRGNVTTDTYSLKGVSAALDRIAKECP
jgi:invasion protein IalB